MTSRILPILLLLFFASEAAAVRHYVDKDATGLDDGTSWTDAFVDLQDALAIAVFGDEIWVARGTYKPTSGTDRFATFRLVDGVKMYGGFAGTESQLSERDESFRSRLSGDIGSATLLDNCYTVVNGDSVSELTVLDGFVVKFGYHGVLSPVEDGAGIHIENGSPTIRNCAFRLNTARSRGGGAYIRNSSSTFTKVSFCQNSANIGGGASINGSDNVDVVFDSTCVDSNLAQASAPETPGGGGIDVYASGTVTINNSFFRRNQAASGGGLRNTSVASIVIEDCYFEGNEAVGGDGGGAVNGAYVIIVDSEFVDNASVDEVSGGGGAVHAIICGIIGSTFQGNSSDKNGGAIYCSFDATTIIDCDFQSNSAKAGGAIWAESASISGCDISANGATTVGGGIALATSAFGDADISDVQIHDNTATDGAGIYIEEARAPLEIVNAAIQDNTATGRGGGIYSGTLITVSSSLITGNSAADGGGIATSDSPSVYTNLTISDNSATNGGAVWSTQSAPTFSNCILWGDNATVGPEVFNTGGSVTLTHCIAEGSGGSGGGWDLTYGVDGGSNLDVDPLFVAPLSGDYHLIPGSIAFNNGDNAAPGISALDLDGNQRIQETTIDIGAYEGPAMPTGIGDNDVPVGATRLASVYPNPFNPVVRVIVDVASAGPVEVAVYDIRGGLVARLSEGHRSAGRFALEWDGLSDSGQSAASGVYFVRMSALNVTDTRKIVLLK